MIWFCRGNALLPECGRDAADHLRDVKNRRNHVWQVLKAQQCPDCLQTKGGLSTLKQFSYFLIDHEGCREHGRVFILYEGGFVSACMAIYKLVL